MITKLEEKLLDLIDEGVTQASPDELFAGGYLRGHISLSAADCEFEGIRDVEGFKSKIQQSIDDARSELTPADQAIVVHMWKNLLAQVSE